jgi:putative PEP-CTERM system TPR-repeat lipoprotein
MGATVIPMCQRLLPSLCIILVAAACSRDHEALKRQYLEQGNGHFAKQEYREAVLAYRNALRQDEKFGEARKRLAEAYEQLGDGANAFREYIRAADLLPDDRVVQLKVGFTYLRSGKFEDAKERAMRLVKRDARDVDALILLANALAGMKDHTAAVQQANEAIALDPDQVRSHIALGGIEQASGNPVEAEAAFKQALATSPKSADAHLALASFYASVGRGPEAEDLFAKALALDPSNLLAHRVLAFYYLSTNRLSEAEKHLKAFASLSPTIEAQLGLANFYARQRRYNDARLTLTPLTARSDVPSSVDILLSAVDYADGRREEAHKRLDAVLSRQPTNVDAMVQKARWQLGAGQNDQALQTANGAVKLAPEHVEALYVAGMALAATGDTEGAIKSFVAVLERNPGAIAARSQLARLHLARGGTAAATQYAEDAVAAQPGNAVARLILAQALISAGQLSRAEPHVRWLLEQRPDVAEVQALAGAFRLAGGQLTDAKRHFERSVSIDPTGLDGLRGLIATDLRSKRLPDALARIEARLKQTPNDPQLLLLAAETYAHAGDAQRVEAFLKQAIANGDSSVTTYARLASLYVAQKRVDEAVAETGAMLAKQPNSVSGHTLMGILAEFQNKRDVSARHFARALEIDPHAAVAANNLAWVYAEQNINLDQALQMAQMAKQHLPDDPEVSDTLGWIYLKKGFHGQAIEQLQQSVNTNPRKATYQFHLGLAYAKAGDQAKARAALGQALALQPNFSGADEARKTLASLDR